jgi:hypothetical protein
VQVLKQCGDDLTRENVMKQAASLKDFTPDTLLPGIKINTSPTDFAPIEQLKMMQFKGEKWIFSAISSAPKSAASSREVVAPKGSTKRNRPVSGRFLLRSSP